MRVTVLELPATWGDPRSMLCRVENALAAGPESDLVLLPEASLTGYVSPEGDFDLSPFAEPLGGPTHQALAALARRRGIVLVAPLVLAENGAVLNAMLGLDPDGELLFTYRKRHPWFPETWASAGRGAAPLVRVGSVVVTIAICYDIHFLEEDAAAALDASDLLLFPSAWVEKEDSRPELFGELARRHGVAIANANWAPGVVRIPGQGGSSIRDGGGAVVAEVGRGGKGRADAILERRSAGAS